MNHNALSLHKCNLLWNFKSKYIAIQCSFIQQERQTEDKMKVASDTYTCMI